MKEHNFKINTSKTQLHCEVFEDNSRAIEMARHRKFRPRTQFLNIRLFHSRSYVDKGKISIHPRSTFDQPTNILTKPLNKPDFKQHQKEINGWLIYY